MAVDWLFLLSIWEARCSITSPAPVLFFHLDPSPSHLFLSYLSIYLPHFFPPALHIIHLPPPSFPFLLRSLAPSLACQPLQRYQALPSGPSEVK